MKKDDLILTVITVMIVSLIFCLPVFSKEMTFYQSFNVMLAVFDVKTVRANKGVAEQTLKIAKKIAKESDALDIKEDMIKNMEDSIDQEYLQEDDKKSSSEKRQKTEKDMIEIDDIQDIKTDNEEKESFSLMSEEDFNNALSNNPLKNEIIRLSLKKSERIRKKTLKKILLMNKDQAKHLVPFMKTRDLILLKNISLILGVFNHNAAFSSFIKRINYERNQDVLKFLYLHVSLLTKFEIEPFLNNLFIQENDEKTLEVIAYGLKQRSDSKTINKARNLLETTQNKELKVALHSLLAYQGFTEESVNFAKSWILKSDKKLQVKLLGLMRFSQNSDDVDFLINNKRIFYQTKKTFDAYDLAIAFIKSKNLKETEKLDFISDKLGSNKVLLAKLSLYAAKLWTDSSFIWLKDFAKKHYLLEFQDFIYALNLRGIPLNEAMEKSEEKMQKKETKADSKQLWATAFSAANLAFEFKDDLQFVVIDDKKLQAENLKDLIKIPVGKHRFKFVFKDKSFLYRAFSFKKNDSVVITIEKKRSSDEENSIGMAFTHVPDGRCIIGNNVINETEHLVYFSKPLLVGKYEVTNSQYELFDKHHNNERDNRSSDDRQPVILVTWYDALKFCNWLSDQEGLFRCYDENTIFQKKANGYRLLTESEWEYAAKSGVSTNRYPSGDYLDIGSVYTANFFPKGGSNIDGYKFTAPVGSFKDNDFGLFDMAGNVSEWCYDWYEEKYYNKLSTLKKVVDPLGPKTGSFKVCRGGSWYSRDALQCAFREFAHPGSKANTRGFRVCKRWEPYKITIKTA